MARPKVHWKKEPEEADFEAALSYLHLLYSKAAAKKIIASLRTVPQIRCAAKDLLRASALPLLGDDNAQVVKDLKRIHRAKALPPVLLVRGDPARGIPLVVADGYHRICAVYHFDEDAPICCRLAELGKAD